MAVVRTVVGALLLVTTGCSTADKSADFGTVTASGYPIGAMFEEFSSVCKDTSTSKIAYDAAVARGWAIVEDINRSPIAPFVEAMNSVESSMQLGAQGMDIVAVPIMRKTIGKEDLFLLIQNLRMQNSHRMECQVIDAAERRLVTESELENTVGRTASESLTAPLRMQYRWVPGIRLDHASLYFTVWAVPSKSASAKRFDAILFGSRQDFEGH
jgi:hypothetical protein